MAGEENNVGTVELDENGFIPGTTFKTVGDLLKGHLNLKEMSDKQANELGTVRKEHEGLKNTTDTLASVLKETLNKGQQQGNKDTKTVDYGAELAAVEKQILELDPMADDYQKTLASLVSKSTKLAAADQHEKTLSAAGKMFKDELSERDVKAAQDTFYRENPTFNTPEMQARIKERIAGDKTGMLDALAAYRELQRDDVAAEKDRLAAENAEMKRLVELNKGKDEAGKVITKGQSTGQQHTKTAKATGKDLDAGMMAALKAANAG